MTVKPVLFSAAAVVLVASSVLAFAQDFPTKKIEIVVPAAPGGPNDVVARAASKILATLGQPVIVVNKPGAGGMLGAREVANAAADGHTLLVGNTATLAIIPATVPNAGYDATTAFAPVAKFWESYQVLVVAPDLPAKTLAEFINYVRANPKKLNYAHGGTGGLPHLAFEMFKARAGIDMVGIAYRSDAETMTAVMSGAVQAALPNIAVALPLVRDGKLRALATTGPKRSPVAPDIPTMRESGLHDYEVAAFFGIVAPASTPKTVVHRLNAVLNEGLKEAEYRELADRIGVIPSQMSSDDFGNYLSRARDQWKAAAHNAGF